MEYKFSKFPNLLTLLIGFVIFLSAQSMYAQCNPISGIGFQPVITQATCNPSDTNKFTVSFYVVLKTEGGITGPYTYVTGTDNYSINPSVSGHIGNDTLYVNDYVVTMNNYPNVNATMTIRDSCSNPVSIYIYNYDRFDLQNLPSEAFNYNLCDSVFSIFILQHGLSNFSVFGLDFSVWQYIVPVPGAGFTQIGDTLHITGLEPNLNYLVSFENPCGKHYSSNIYTSPNNYQYSGLENQPEYVCDSAGLMGGYIVPKLSGPFSVVNYSAYPTVPDTPTVYYIGDTIKFDHLIPDINYSYTFVDGCNSQFTVNFVTSAPPSAEFTSALNAIYCDSTFSVTLKTTGDNSRYYFSSVISSNDGIIPTLTTVSYPDSIIVSGFYAYNFYNSYTIKIRDTICHNDQYQTISLSSFGISTSDYLNFQYVPAACNDGNGNSMQAILYGVPPFNITWLSGPNTPTTTTVGNTVIFKNLIAPLNLAGNDSFYVFSLQDDCGVIDTFRIPSYSIPAATYFNTTILSESGGCDGSSVNSGAAKIVFSTYPQAVLSNPTITGPGSPTAVCSGDSIALGGLAPLSDYIITFTDSCGFQYAYKYTSTTTNTSMQINVTTIVNALCSLDLSIAYALRVTVANANPPYNVYLSGAASDSLIGLTSFQQINFDSLAQGTYQIRVIDACNNIQTQNYTIQNVGYLYEYYSGGMERFLGCDSIRYTFSFGAYTQYNTGAIIDYKHSGLVRAYVIRNGDTIYASEIYPELKSNSSSLIFTFPSRDTFLSPELMYVTDGCGHVHPTYIYNYLSYGYNTVCEAGELSNRYIIYPYGGGSANYPLRYTFLSGSPTPTITEITITDGSDVDTLDVPTGAYWQYEVRDSCNKLLAIASFNGPYAPYSYYQTRQCAPKTSGDHKANLYIYNYYYSQDSLKLHQVSGPSVIPDTIVPNGNYGFTFNNIDTGSYVFEITELNACGRTYTLNARAEPYLDSARAVFVPGCLNANKLVLYYYSNINNQDYRVLSPLTVQFSTYLNGSYISFGSVDTLYNVPSSSIITINGPYCFQDTFHTPAYVSPSIKASAGFSCMSGFSLSILGGGGVKPYTYEILSGTPVNYYVAPQSSNIFTGLPAYSGNSYQVRLTDQCGNAFTTMVRADSINNPLQQVGFRCVGSDYSATVDSIPNIVYIWTKPDGSTVQGRTLAFNPISYADTGSYTLTLTNTITGCVSNIVHNIRLTDCALQAVQTHTDLLCATSSNGTIDVSTAGGTKPYSYLWNDGITTEDRSGLKPGTYTLIITDNVGARDTLDVVLASPDSLKISESHVDVPTCYGSSGGSIDISPTGGVTAYAYNWSNGATTEDLTDITAGDYTVTVTDANNCTNNLTVSIGQPDSISLFVSQTDVSCYNANNGTVDLGVLGGTAPYTYGWSNGDANEDLGGLSAGDYSVTVTDANNCTNTRTITITQPDSIVLSETHTDVSCFGSDNGSINLTVSGTTTPYTYGWSNGDADEDINDLAIGDYTVTVTDANNCTNDLTITIAQPDSISLSLTHTDVSCYGGDNGSIDLSAAGGTNPYTYNWSNGDGSEDLSNLTPGDYTVTVTDVNNCSKELSVTIAQPDSIPMSETHVDASCFGSGSGSIDLTMTGSTGPYTYNWSNGATSEDLTDITAGDYTVTVTDDNGCTNDITITVAQPDPMPLASGRINVTCYGGNNGSIDITPLGGIAPYTYNWSNGATSEDITTLTAGDYTVTATDGNGCTADLTVNITQPDSIVIAETHTNLSCYRANDGSIDLTVTGGVNPYNYSWNNAEVSQDLTDLSAGEYSVTVTDLNNCTNALTVSITQPDPLTLTETHENISCYGNNDGSIDLNVAGGTTPYNYAWSNGAASQDLTDLAPGSYSVSVTDANNCSNDLTVNIAQPDSIIIQNVTFNTATGEVRVIALNPTPDMVYHVVWISPDSLPIPPSNSTGIFTLIGATKAAFQISRGGCVSAIDTVDFGIPLPVDFLSFTAVLSDKNKAKLDWHVIEFPSTAYYEIEKSVDGKQFSTIGRLDIKAPSSPTKKSYQHIDSELAAGYNFYRIKETDRDGKTTYSRIRLVNYVTKGSDVATLYPNPTSGIMTLEYEAAESGELNAWVTDVLGRTVIGNITLKQLKGYNRINIDAGHLPDGTYFLHYHSDDRQVIESIKFIKKGQ